MYYIGIDSSGAYSRLLAVDQKMSVIGRHTGKSMNLRMLPGKTVLDNLITLIDEVNTLTNNDIKDCYGVCMGSDGVILPEDADAIEQIMRQVGFECPVKAVNNAELILAAETKGMPGIALHASAELIAFAIDKNGRTYRVGGWGHLIGDAGSGYWIGMQAVKAALAQYDGGEKTILTDKICSQFKLKHIERIIDYIYGPHFNRSKISELSLLVKYSASEGDKVACAIEDTAAAELYRLAETLILRHDLTEHKVVLNGSVILLNDNIKSKLTQKVTKSFPGVRTVDLKDKPELGAVHLAMNLI